MQADKLRSLRVELAVVRRGPVEGLLENARVWIDCVRQVDLDAIAGVRAQD